MKALLDVELAQTQARSHPQRRGSLGGEPEGSVERRSRGIPPGGLYAPPPSPGTVEEGEQSPERARESLAVPQHGQDSDVPDTEAMAPFDVDAFLEGITGPTKEDYSETHDIQISTGDSDDSDPRIPDTYGDLRRLGRETQS